MSEVGSETELSRGKWQKKDPVESGATSDYCAKGVSAGFLGPAGLPAPSEGSDATRTGRCGARVPCDGM